MLLAKNVVSFQVAPCDLEDETVKEGIQLFSFLWVVLHGGSLAFPLQITLRLRPAALTLTGILLPRRMYRP